MDILGKIKSEINRIFGNTNLTEDHTDVEVLDILQDTKSIAELTSKLDDQNTAIEAQNELVAGMTASHEELVKIINSQNDAIKNQNTAIEKLKLDFTSELKAIKQAATATATATNETLPAEASQEAKEAAATVDHIKAYTASRMKL